MKKVTDVSRGARETKVDLSQFSIYARGPDIYSGKKPTGQTRGFWLFWLRPEGGVYMPGFNLTICRGSWRHPYSTATCRLVPVLV